MQKQELADWLKELAGGENSQTAQMNLICRDGFKEDAAIPPSMSVSLLK